MIKKLNCILLIDDDNDCNFYHQRLLKKMDCTDHIEIAKDGKMALDFLKSTKNTPSIIFLDINMPKMDGWEFLAEFEKLTAGEKAKVVILMVISSLNPDDKDKAESFDSVDGFSNKYLDVEAVEKILLEHFPDDF